MTQIIEFVILLSVIALIWILSIKVYKRLYFLRIMKRLSKVEGIKIRMLCNPFLSLLKISNTPEYILNIYGDTYLVRLYNGAGISKSVHFASEKFTVRYSRLRAYSYQPGVGRVIRTRGLSLGARVKIIPEILLPEGEVCREPREILVFNPAPSEVSFVVKEKNSIRAAFTGDEVFGRRIFTASTFEIFADREARRIRNERRAGTYLYK